MFFSYEPILFRATVSISASGRVNFRPSRIVLRYQIEENSDGECPVFVETGTTNYGPWSIEPLGLLETTDTGIAELCLNDEVMNALPPNHPLYLGFLDRAECNLAMMIRCVSEPINAATDIEVTSRLKLRLDFVEVPDAAQAP